MAREHRSVLANHCHRLDSRRCRSARSYPSVAIIAAFDWHWVLLFYTATTEAKATSPRTIVIRDCELRTWSVTTVVRRRIVTSILIGK